MATYYCNNGSTGGVGNGLSLATPWQWPDVLNQSTWAIGTALNTLQPGDTLYFRGGDYHITDTTVVAVGDGRHFQYIYPANSGTSGAPITLRSYPGEVAVIYGDAGVQRSIMGCHFPSRDHVRFLGFKVVLSNFTNGANIDTEAAFETDGTGTEVGWCEIVGTTIPTNTLTDNHCGIFVNNPGTSTWINHNILHEFHGPSMHTEAIISWTPGTTTYEDNWFYNNDYDVIEKGAIGGSDGQKQSTWRRNWFQKSGQLEDFIATIFFYDNVVQGSVNIKGYQQNSSFYNNLFMNLYLDGGGYDTVFRMGAGVPAIDNNIWNNIAIAETTILKSMGANQAYQQADPGATFTYFDYNVYTQQPYYNFSSDSTSYTLALFQSSGVGPWEVHAIKDTIANIFVDTTAYVLKTAYQTAGRGGSFASFVGPGVSNNPATGSPITTAQIINSARYGPAALPIGGGVNDHGSSTFRAGRRPADANFIASRW